MKRSVGGLFATLLIASLLGPSHVATASRSVGWPAFCDGKSVNGVKAKAALVGPSIRGISLALSAESVKLGQAVYARLLNPTNTLASYGPYHRIEQYSQSGWAMDPANPATFAKVIRGLRPGRASSCFSFAVPMDHPTGVYRFVVPAKVDGAKAGRKAVFRVEE